MFDIQGKVNSAKVFADGVEGSAIEQIHRMLDHPAFADLQIRIMPDVHWGQGSVIGFTSSLGPKVIPNLIGVDIGCGVASFQLVPTHTNFEKFEKWLLKHVPFGFGLRDERYAHLEDVFSKVPQKLYSFSEFEAGVRDVVGRLEPGSAPERADREAKVWKALGTLGGGNHFIEIERADDKSLWLTIHTGSRNFGLRIATHHQKIAVERVGKMGGLEYLEGTDRDQYVADMKLAQVYAALNRRVIADLLFWFWGTALEEVAVVESVHNYINFDDGIMRKGAISAHAGERVIIPLHMEAGCIVGIGKGIADWNYSAPHGAGRVMSRSKAKASLDVDHYRKVMRRAGVWTTSVNESTLDESPMAYKRPEGIIEAVRETVDIETIMRPVYVFKDHKKTDEGPLDEREE